MSVVAFRKVKEPHGWLGNMAPYPITYMGDTWRTSEALFQALRTDDHDAREQIRAAKSPMAAKMVAKRLAACRTVAPMGPQDLSNMLDVLRLKLEAHPCLKDALLATGDATIVEDCTARPRGSGLFWGAQLLEDGSWHGSNTLGRMWMRIREELKDAV